MAKLPRRLTSLVLAIALWTGALVAHGDEQRRPIVAAAANLNVALTEIAEQFARDGGVRLELVFGASGTLTRQIRDGAPFELFLAADEEFPNMLVKAGLARDAGASTRSAGSRSSPRPARRSKSTSASMGSRVS